MKNVITIIMIVTISINATAYDLIKSQDDISTTGWNAGQVDIYLDPTLDNISSDAKEIVVNSFMTWSDYMDREVVFNFIEAPCEEYSNCVSFGKSEESHYSRVARTDSWLDADKALIQGRIKFFNHVYWSTPGTEGDYDLAHTALHEAGHFLGLGHSSNGKAVMHFYKHSTELHQDDINGIMTLYGDGTVYPSVDSAEEVQCSVGNVGENSWGNLFNLLF